MVLSDGLLDQVTAALAPSAGVAETAPPAATASSAAPLPAQRRRGPRLVARARITIIPLADSTAVPFEVAIRDFSAGGIGFLHRARISLDEQFVALLPAGAESVAVLCRVAFYQPLPDQGYSIGARFVRVLRRPAADDAGLPLPNSQSSPLRAAS